MAKSFTVLAVLGLTCGYLLHAVNQWTAPVIEANRAHARTVVFRQMLDQNDEQPTVAVAIEKGGNCATWFALHSSVAGYAGPIGLAFVWNASENVISTRVVHHQETPGFGDFITGQWLADLDSSSAADWQELDRVSGATITFKAIQNAAMQQIRLSQESCRG